MGRVARRVRVCVDAVGEFGSSQKEKQHQEWRKTQTANERKEGVKGPQRPVHITVNVASKYQYCQLCNKEANDHQAQH